MRTTRIGSGGDGGRRSARRGVHLKVKGRDLAPLGHLNVVLLARAVGHRRMRRVWHREEHLLELRVDILHARLRVLHLGLEPVHLREHPADVLTLGLEHPDALGLAVALLRTAVVALRRCGAAGCRDGGLCCGGCRAGRACRRSFASFCAPLRFASTAAMLLMSSANFLRASCAAASARASSVRPLAWKSDEMLPLAMRRLLICLVCCRKVAATRLVVYSLPAEVAKARPDPVTARCIALSTGLFPCKAGGKSASYSHRT